MKTVQENASSGSGAASGPGEGVTLSWFSLFCSCLLAPLEQSASLPSSSSDESGEARLGTPDPH